MSGRSKLWIISALLYGAFVFWYTDFGGPLSDAEIEEWKQTMTTNGTMPERVEYFEDFFRNDSGRQFLMVNAIDMNENPPDVEGAEPGETATQLMDRYLEHMLREQFIRASHPVILGSAVYPALDLLRIEEGRDWDAGAIFRYKSRRAFMQIIANPATLERHDFKLAALEKTIAYPIETSIYLGDLRLLLGLALLAIVALLDSLVFARRN
ncbi:MAG: hypothetical protein AAF431_15470 [Pseudomonadota bacterium]